MRRRDFIKAIAGSAALLPIAARAQRPGLPVIGFMNGASPDTYARELAAFLKGLGEGGYVDGQNVTIEYRWAEGQLDRLPVIAADLVKHEVAVIAATSAPAAVAAKAATRTIPIVFETGGDPVKLGLVGSLNRPGGNVTGIAQLNLEIAPKRLELLHELVPAASRVVFLANPENSLIVDINAKELQPAARSLSLELNVLSATNDREIDEAFAKLAQLKAGALLISPETFFISRSKQLAELTLRHRIPAAFTTREFVAAGGLMSYGSSYADAYRLAGLYTARVLKGEKAGDLPVQQSTKIELFLNLKTAKALGINVPNTLAGRADEVIE
jgi:putative ABC transport system substrate-binding protein